MSRTRLLSVVGVSLLSAAAVIVVSQATSPSALPAEFRTHLEAERFQIVTSMRGLPLGVREALQKLFGSGGLDIADPGAEFQKTGASTNSLIPIRRLIAAGCANDHHCLVYYERGGATVTQRVAFFHWKPSETRFEWGGDAPAGLASIDDVRKAILSGRIKANQGGPW